MDQFPNTEASITFILDYLGNQVKQLSKASDKQLKTSFVFTVQRQGVLEKAPLRLM